MLKLDNPLNITHPIFSLSVSSSSFFCQKTCKYIVFLDDNCTSTSPRVYIRLLVFEYGLQKGIMLLAKYPCIATDYKITFNRCNLSLFCTDKLLSAPCNPKICYEIVYSQDCTFNGT
jgi:hypothetical protein